MHHTPGRGDSCTICTTDPGRAVAGGNCAGDAGVVTGPPLLPLPGPGLAVKLLLLPTAAAVAAAELAAAVPAAADAEERCRLDRPARRRGRTG